MEPARSSEGVRLFELHVGVHRSSRGESVTSNAGHDLRRFWNRSRRVVSDGESPDQTQSAWATEEERCKACKARYEARRLIVELSFTAILARRAFARRCTTHPAHALERNKRTDCTKFPQRQTRSEHPHPLRFSTQATGSLQCEQREIFCGAVLMLVPLG